MTLAGPYPNRRFEAVQPDSARKSRPRLLSALLFIPQQGMKKTVPELRETASDLQIQFVGLTVCGSRTYA